MIRRVPVEQKKLENRIYQVYEIFISIIFPEAPGTGNTCGGMKRSPAHRPRLLLTVGVSSPAVGPFLHQAPEGRLTFLHSERDLSLSFEEFQGGRSLAVGSKQR